MSSDEQSYYAERAETERRLAAGAAHPAAAEVHRTLAAAYSDRAASAASKIEITADQAEADSSGRM